MDIIKVLVTKNTNFIEKSTTDLVKCNNGVNNITSKYESVATFALNVRFTTNGMCAKNNTIYMWREQAIIK